MSRTATLADGVTLGTALALSLLAAVACSPAMRGGAQEPTIVTFGQLAAPAAPVAYGAPPQWTAARWTSAR